jgi:hypothetical protein
MKTFGPASLIILFAGFALLVWLAFESPGALAVALMVAVLIFLVGAFTGRPIR